MLQSGNCNNAEENSLIGIGVNGNGIMVHGKDVEENDDDGIESVPEELVGSNHL
jgi:hypothetical protein